jgi:hypothetical protein
MTTDALLACPPMTAPRIALAVTLMVAGWACSSSGRKDQFYGTDVGASWIPPDATARDAPADASATASVDASAEDTSSDTADAGTDALDAGPSADAPAGDI